MSRQRQQLRGSHARLWILLIAAVAYLILCGMVVAVLLLIAARSG